MYKTLFKQTWLRRYATMFAFISFSLNANAQADYWSIFGITGCPGASNSNAMFTQVTTPGPSAFTGITSIVDPDALPNNIFPLAHTVYNTTGQPLFSVDQNGIYNPNGVRAFNFTLGFSTTISGTSINAKEALSEVCTFPCKVSADNSSYYAVFWAHNNGIEGAVLRAVKIDIDASGSLSFTDNILYDNTANGVISTPAGDNGLNWDFTIAADMATCSSGRNIYTTEWAVVSHFEG